jgi:hypothetical protein
MKKKTVILTEKREVWVVREAIPEPAQDETIDVKKAIEVPSFDDGAQEADYLERSESNDQ